MYLILILAICGTGLYFIIQAIFTRSYNSKPYPPGPLGLPIVGSILSVGNRPYVKFAQWSKVYGPIFSIQKGRLKSIVLNDASLIKEAFSLKAFNGRPNNKAFSVLAGGKHDSETWSEQRRFTLRHLRNFGFGKQNMETLIMDEVNEVLDWLTTKVNQPVLLHQRFTLSVFNALWMIIAGKRFRHDDPYLTRMIDNAAQISRDLIETGGPIMFFPELAKYFPELSGWNKLLKSAQPVIDLFQNTILAHRETIQEGFSRDFIDAYLHEVERTTEATSSFHPNNSDASIRAVVADLFIAGSDTTSTTLAWACLYLLRNRKVQIKFQEEIDEVIGRGRCPTLTDKPRMPYTEALAMETMRMSSILPMGVFHSAMSDVAFRGYQIPKDTLIVSNLSLVHHDQNIWGDPDTFRPERFLSPDGSTVQKHEYFLAFSHGPRSCPGEPLARDEIFLFLTSIFQKFDVFPDPENLNPSVEPEVGFVLAPKQYTAIVKNRIFD